MSQAPQDAQDARLTEAVKAVHRCFPTGVTVVTTVCEGQPYGLAVNAFSSISLEPPLVLVCVAARSATYDHLFRADQVAVNILSSDQREVAAVFAKSGGDKFRDVAWRPGRNGAPLLDRVAAHFELAIERRLPAYTHTIFIGRVLDAHTTGRPPLVYYESEFFDGGAFQVLNDERP
jgi:flavin reductase (DIM6/NTAB) family NADH-FMN oxidoreductase RutF